METLTLVRERFPGHPAMDIAVSHAILAAVGRGEIGPVFRLYVPDRILAFGRTDRLHIGYPGAVRAAEAHGFTAVERLAGGHAAVFHESTLAFSWAVPDNDPRAGIRDRFSLVAAVMAGAFKDLGMDARVGEIPGEYCPGEWSVNLGGRVKVMGTGQRLVRGAAHVGGVVVVDGAREIRNVLVPVYRALRLDWDPRTTGALADRSPGLTNKKVRKAIVAALTDHFEVEKGDIPHRIVADATALVPQHLPAVA